MKLAGKKLSSPVATAESVLRPRASSSLKARKLPLPVAIQKLWTKPSPNWDRKPTVIAPTLPSPRTGSGSSPTSPGISAAWWTSSLPMPALPAGHRPARRTRRSSKTSLIRTSAPHFSLSSPLLLCSMTTAASSSTDQCTTIWARPARLPMPRQKVAWSPWRVSSPPNLHRATFASMSSPPDGRKPQSGSAGRARTSRRKNPQN